MDVIRTVHATIPPTNCRHVHDEHMKWLQTEGENDRVPPIWSRLRRRNLYNQPRRSPQNKYRQFDIEIPEVLYSLWGTLHPDAAVFSTNSRGKQYLACNVLACCATTLYPVLEWTPQLLDTLVINGDRYHRESLAKIKRADYEFSLEDMNAMCRLENVRFKVHLEHVAYGQLYDQTQSFRSMNLAKALISFFNRYSHGILQCHRRSFAIGRTQTGTDEGFFMYDCQSRDYPIFPQGQGATYVLQCRHLQALLYCIVVTLNVRLYNVQFSLHSIAVEYDGMAIRSVPNGIGMRMRQTKAKMIGATANTGTDAKIQKQAETAAESKAAKEMSADTIKKPNKRSRTKNDH